MHQISSIDPAADSQVAGIDRVLRLVTNPIPPRTEAASLEAPPVSGDEGLGLRLQDDDGREGRPGHRPYR